MADTVLDYAASYYQNALGLTPEQARGAARWMSRRESGLDPSAFNPAGGGQGALGIAQWRGPRQKALLDRYGPNPTFDQQLAFSVSELQGPESKALHALRSAKTEGDAFNAWGQSYERPGPQREGVYGGALHVNVGRQGAGQNGDAIDALLALAAPQPAAPKPGPAADADEGAWAFLASLAGPQEARQTPASQNPRPNTPEALPAPQPLPEPAASPYPMGSGEPQPIRPAMPAMGAAGADALDRLLEMARGDPEAAGAAATSQAMQPATQPFVDLGKNLIQHLAVEPLTEGYKTTERVMAGEGFTPEEALDTAGLAMAGSIGRGGLGAGPRLPARIEPPPVSERLPAAGGGGLPPPEPPGPPRMAGGHAEPPPRPSGPVSVTARPAEPQMLDNPIPGESERATVTRIDDALNRLVKNTTADRLELDHLAGRLPQAQRAPEFQAKVSADVERRLVDPGAALDPETEAFLRSPGVKELVVEQSELGSELRRMLGKDADLADLPSSFEGYVHRIRSDRPSTGLYGRLDPEAGRTGDVVTGGGKRSLSRFASGLANRDFYVLQDEAGNRVFAKQSRAKAGYEYGQTISTPDPAKPGGSKTWTVKQPTMAEIEANTEARYHKNFLANTIENVSRLRRVKRNVAFLDQLKEDLKDRDLFHQERFLIGREAGVERWVKNQAERPEGLTERIHLPGMDGWTTPKIAKVLNEFYNAPGSDLDNFLTRANRFLIGSLFVTPIPHAHNVLAHWAVGRGFDWLSPPAYVRGAKAGAKALRSVWTTDEHYQRMLREGSGLLYGDVATENFYNTMMKKLFREQMADQTGAWAEFAKGHGLKGVKDLVKAEYRWSRKTLWALNDMMMLQRQFELEMKGLRPRDAIQAAEKDIPNYRIPPEVMGSAAMSDFLKSPIFMNFGRYKYGQIRALGLMVKELVGKDATAAQRMEALGKLTVLGAIGTMAYPGLDWALQQVTGNDNASVRRAGPMSLVSAAGSKIPQSVRDSLPESISGLLPPDKGWATAIASLLTPAPMLNAGFEVARPYDWAGRPLIDGNASPTGMAAQGIEAAAGSFFPAQLGIDAMRQGPAAALGRLGDLKLPEKPPYKPSGRAQRLMNSRSRRREQNDPLKRAIDNIVGVFE